MISLQVNLDMSVALARMVTPEDLQAMTRHLSLIHISEPTRH